MSFLFSYAKSFIVMFLVIWSRVLVKRFSVIICNNYNEKEINYVLTGLLKMGTLEKANLSLDNLTESYNWFV